jgi:hypothetical protein
MVALPVMLAWEGERSGVEVGRRGRFGVVGGVEGTRGDVCVTKGPAVDARRAGVSEGNGRSRSRWEGARGKKKEGEGGEGGSGQAGCWAAASLIRESAHRRRVW